MRRAHFAAGALFLCVLAGDPAAAVPALPEAVAAVPVRIHRLDNDVVFVYQEKPGSGTFALHLALRGGWGEDPDDAYGLSGILASTLMRGTATRTAREQALALDREGLMHSVSAGTSAIVMTATGPPEGFDTAFDVLSDALVSPSLAGEDVAKEIALAQQTYRTARDQPSGELWRTARPLIFEDHPLGRVSDPTRYLHGITKQAVRKAFSERLAGRRLVAVVVGDIDAARARRAVDNALADVAAGDTAPRMPAPHPLGEERRARAKRRTSQPEIVVAMPTAGIPEADLAAMDLLSHILGGFQERLSTEIREKRGWAYWLRTVDWRLPRAGLFGIHTGVPKKHLAETEVIIRTELDRIASEPPTDKEVERARRHRLTELARSWQTASGRAGAYMGDALAGRKPSGFDERAARLEAVTPDHVRALARRLIDSSKLAVVTLY